MEDRSGEQARLISAVEAREEFDQLDDGYWYYFPSKTGALSAQVLRAVAIELDIRNYAWDNQVKSDLSKGG